MTPRSLSNFFYLLHTDYLSASETARKKNSAGCSSDLQILGREMAASGQLVHIFPTDSEVLFPTVYL